jgi:hypothetical protein
MSDADYVLDLNRDYFPFDDNSVDYIYSSHCLEHLTLAGFVHTVGEMYRVLKEEGMLYIVVPYFHHVVNLSNPFHNNKICFNEHTFRFFSSDQHTTALKKEDYAIESCPQWGLRYSENSEIGVELQTIRVNFFYSHEYRYFNEKELRKYRKERLGVVEQISYLLRPVKPCPSRPHTAPISEGGEAEFIQNLLLFQNEQYEYIVANLSNHFGTDLFLGSIKADSRLRSAFDRYSSGAIHFKSCDILYFYGDFLLPASEVCDLLNEQVQQLRYLIDTSLYQLEKS